MSFARKLVAGCTVVGMLGVAGVAGAALSSSVKIEGSGGGKASLKCPGGMSRLGHDFNDNMSVFPYDPEVHVENLYSVDPDYFKVDDIDMGDHAGTHIDVPSHFIDGARSLDDLAAEEFAWPAYKIDVRGMSFVDNFVEQSDIEAYEAEHGDIEPGSLVILQTGAEEFFGLDGENDERISEDGLAVNVDDMFDFENAGFSGPAVQWLYDNRDIGGVGSDAYGPDAFGDELYDATYTTLANDGIALVALANLDSVSVHGDVIIASAVNLTDGAGFPTDPLACHAKPKNN